MRADFPILRKTIKSKCHAILWGESPVASSCQIPHIREKFAAIGLQGRTGTFVEIGAFDGDSYSNTSFLADQGWRGLYVEPIGEFCRKIRLRHLFNDVAVEQVAIDNQAGFLNIKRMGALSTTNNEVADAYASIPWAANFATSKSEEKIRTERLSSVLKRNKIGSKFELMVIDVEGSERLVVELTSFLALATVRDDRGIVRRSSRFC